MFTLCCRSGFQSVHAAISFADSPGPRRASESIPEPIGSVIFTTHKGERAEAILDGEGRWRCPCLPVLNRVLNILFEPGRQPSGEAPFGQAELERVAAWIKGSVSLRSADAGDSS